MKKRSLAGLWNFAIPGAPFEKRKVPGSYPPTGNCLYRTEFSAPETASGRILLVFEGICYEGTPSVNGHPLPLMEPYVDYTYDITDLLKPGTNTLEVSLQDIDAVFGPMTGWCNYSGIVREVFLREVPAVWVEDVFFHASLENGYTLARAQAEVTLRGGDAPVTVYLEKDGVRVAEVQGCTQDGFAVLTMEVTEPKLWSPDTPELYTLVTTAGEDTDTRRVGFKEFAVKGKRFSLNGQPLFLMGSCRHDLQGDVDGHTQSDFQIERDMRMIKDTGLNYVRLVHYPHDRRVLEWADELGLLVSEEPGYWWAKMDDTEMLARGLEVMRKVVHRDRSHVSVAFWLTFNECELTEDFIVEAVKTVRQMDPTHCVSGANCMDKFQTKTLFDKADCDFYTYHPYGAELNLISGGVSPGRQYIVPWQSVQGLCEYLNDKPLLFTEWGGYYVKDNPALMQRFCEEFFRLWKSPDTEPVLTGACHWVFADYYERNRQPNAGCVDGVTVEGLCDMERHPRAAMTVLREVMTKQRTMAEPKHAKLKIHGVGTPGTAYMSLTLPSPLDIPGQQEAWDYEVRRYLDMRIDYCDKWWHMDCGPVLEEPLGQIGHLPVCLPAGRPLIVNGRTGEVELPLSAPAAQELYVIGQVSMTDGYPVFGKQGDPVGEYTLYFADGACQTVPLRNGIEIATVHCLRAATRIDPRGAAIVPAIDLCWNETSEMYRIQMLRIPLESAAPLIALRIRVQEPYAVLVYGMTASM